MTIKQLSQHRIAVTSGLALYVATLGYFFSLTLAYVVGRQRSLVASILMHVMPIVAAYLLADYIFGHKASLRKRLYIAGAVLALTIILTFAVSSLMLYAWKKSITQ